MADALGLSTATVSNVIHGKTKKISDGTVRRVQEKLREMGYIWDNYERNSSIGASYYLYLVVVLI
nr:LacI family DNA-binding transcriptional regulator [Butyrivibrio sp. WCE2006]